MYYDGGEHPLAATLGFLDSAGQPKPFKIWGDLIESVERQTTPDWQENTWYNYEIRHDGDGTYVGRLWGDGQEKPSTPDAKSVGQSPGTEARFASLGINGAHWKAFEMNHSFMEWRTGASDAPPSQGLETAKSQKLEFASYLGEQYGSHLDAEQYARNVLAPDTESYTYEAAIEEDDDFTTADAVEAIDRLKAGEALSELLMAGSVEGGVRGTSPSFDIPAREPVLQEDYAIAHKTGAKAATGAVALELAMLIYEDIAHLAFFRMPPNFQRAVEEGLQALEDFISAITGAATDPDYYIDQISSATSDLYDRLKSGDIGSPTKAVDEVKDIAFGPIRDDIARDVLRVGLNDPWFHGCQLKAADAALEAFDQAFAVELVPPEGSDDDEVTTAVPDGPELAGDFDTVTTNVVDRRSEMIDLFADQSEEIGSWASKIPLGGYLTYVIEIVEDLANLGKWENVLSLGKKVIKFAGRILLIAEALSNLADQINTIKTLKRARVQHNLGLEEIVAGQQRTWNCSN